VRQHSCADYVLVESPSWLDASFYGKWLLAAAEAQNLWSEAVQSDWFRTQIAWWPIFRQKVGIGGNPIASGMGLRGGRRQGRGTGMGGGVPVYGLEAPLCIDLWALEYHDPGRGPR
jgi:hypothetical protein